MNIQTECFLGLGNRRYWAAYDDDTYDGPDSPVGTGDTEAEAVADLREQMDEQA